MGFSIRERIEQGQKRRFISLSISTFSKRLCFNFFLLLEVPPISSKLLKTIVESSCNKTVFFIMTVGNYAGNIHIARKLYKPDLL